MITPCGFLFLSDTSLKDPDHEWKQNSWAVLLGWTGRAFEWAAGILGVPSYSKQSVAFDLALCGLVITSPSHWWEGCLPLGISPCLLVFSIWTLPSVT